MSLTRNAGLIIFVGAAMLFGGCHQSAKDEMKYQVNAFRLSKPIPPPEPLSDKDVQGDPALALCQRGPSASPYVNDVVVAGPTYTPLEVTRMLWGFNAIFEPVIFVLDTLYTPVGCFIQAPWSDVPYKSLTLSSSYTLMPPLPNGPEKVPTYDGLPRP